MVGWERGHSSRSRNDGSANYQDLFDPEVTCVQAFFSFERAPSLKERLTQFYPEGETVTTVSHTEISR